MSKLLSVFCISLGLLVFTANLVTRFPANTLWYVATDGDDNNDCLSPVSACFTMQAAVDKASPDDTIIIATGVYTQNTTFDKSLAVQGAGRESTIVDGNAVSTVFTVTQYSTVTISALTIRNGRAASGGGVYNGGVLTLADCQVAENTAVGAVGTSGGDGGNAYGGGIFNSATLTVSQCLLTDNVAVGGDADGMGRGGNSEGGGIYSVGALILENSIISHSIAAGGAGSLSGHGSGGGIYGSGDIKLQHMRIVSNTADNGGGISSSPYLAGHTAIEVISSVLQNNVASDGGAILDTCSNTLHCRLLVNHTTISENWAGRGSGIYTSGASGSTSVVTITHSTLDRNVAVYDGGALFTRNQIGGTKTATLVNSTVSNNSAGNRAGGIIVYSSGGSSNQLQVINTSIISNSAPTGSGIYAFASTSGLSTVTFQNAIVAGDTLNQNCATGISGMLVSNDHNLENGNSCNFTAPGDLINTNPQVGPLADNGGTTLTHALLAGSPAIDAGDNPACLAEPVGGTDQRDIVRPMDGDNDGSAICDMGAYELEPTMGTPTPTITPTPTPSHTPTATPTDTPTPTLTNTPTPTPSSTPTATPTATPHPLYWLYVPFLTN